MIRDKENSVMCGGVVKFGNLDFSRSERLTIGDDVQLLAIRYLYKTMGIEEKDIVRIPFHRLADWDGEYVILPISFPLYGYHAEMKITQFSPKIIPVFLGLSVLDTHLSDEEVQYLRRFAPIGCRDGYTMRIMRTHGITAYLGGCMSASLPARDKAIQGDTIYCIDVQDDLLPYIPEEIKKQAVFVSHLYYPEDCPLGAEKKAEEVYGNYWKSAKLIITSRLHGALPCVAMGIPVIFAKDKMSFRFLGANSLIHVYTRQEWGTIDWNPAPIMYEELKTLIIQNAAKRIREAYEKYSSIYRISAFYEANAAEECHVEFYTNTEDYLERNFEKYDSFSYILWGVTQTASSVDAYIRGHYPNARLAGVIDKKKRLIFHGVKTDTKEILENHRDAWCFVCTGAAILESYRYFEKIGHTRFYQCCEDGKKHEKEAGYHNSFSNVYF